MDALADPEMIAAAMTQAWRASQDSARPARATAVDALRTEGRAAAARSIVYETPTGPDAHGFLAIGELHDRSRRRTGMVLFHPATQSVRVTWVLDPEPAD